LTLDPATWPRATLDEATVCAYVATLGRGDSFAPIHVFCDGRGVLRVADGWHRVKACRRVGRTDIPAVIHRGTFRDVICFAIDASARPDVSRSEADTRKAIALLLALPESLTWPDDEIVRLAHASPAEVDAIRQQIPAHRFHLESSPARRRRRRPAPHHPHERTDR
jgi:hypothetical protein